MLAYLVEPTLNYERGLLGDTVEARGFIVERENKRLLYRLPRGPVFEDRRVRLADLDKDGKPEAIVVKSYPDRGAALAVYRILDDQILPMAESSPIGKRYRWLNPVGVADFTGAGEQMITAVISPHSAGSLRLYQLTGNKLEPVARIDGYTNHILGSKDLDLAGIVDSDGDGIPEIAIPSMDRSSLNIISFANGTAKVRKSIAIAGRILMIDRLQPASVDLRTEHGQARIDLR